VSAEHAVHLVVDGTAHEVTVEGCESLLTVLRDRLGLTATKDACQHGACGSCSVWLDEEVVCSCVVPVVQADGARIRTVASADDQVRAVQEALVRCGAIQCGFCTPGIAVTAADLLQRVSAPTEADVIEALEGNLCRCTGYAKIVDAVRSAIGASGG
jgi:aerobic carbon-monoxide dehydrogenase small subunit